MKIKYKHLFPLMLLISSTALANENTNSTYNWTGVYLGGFVGGASSANVNNSEPQYPNGNFWNISGINNNYDTSASFIGGGTVGYNWQLPESPLLLGLEGEYGYLGMSGSKIDPNSATYNALTAGSEFPQDNSVSSTKIGGSYGYGLVGGRIGYAIDRALIYIKSGAVFTTTQSTFSDSNYDTSVSGKRNNNAGYALGAGVEYALPFTWSKNISVKTEYLYFGIDRTTPASGVNGANNSILNYNSNISGIHTAKVGVNYKF
jgi:outer membrane immunogenic protein